MYTRTPRCCSEDNRSCCCSGEIVGQNACCSSPQKLSHEKRLIIEFMYIDLTTCDRCLGTDASLADAIAEVAKLLDSAGYEVEVRNVLVETEEQALELGFVSSPTIRINGQDIQLEHKESLCSCCGEIAGQDIDCRVWLWQGQEYTTPPKQMLVDSILRYIYGGKQSSIEPTPKLDEVPDNLRRFFAGKKGKK